MSEGNRDLAAIADTVEPVARGLDGNTAARARAVVVAHARDGEDRRLLLEILGLSERPD